MTEERAALIKKVWEHWRCNPALRRYAHLPSINLPMYWGQQIMPHAPEDDTKPQEVSLTFSRVPTTFPDGYKIVEIMCEGLVVERYDA